MPDVLDKSDTLNEAWLDDTAVCQYCTEPATFIARMRCCGKTGLVGSTCVHRARSQPVPRHCVCTYCKANLMPTTYDDLVSLVPV
jgi:hypothetical protein